MHKQTSGVVQRFRSCGALFAAMVVASHPVFAADNPIPGYDSVRAAYRAQDAAFNRRDEQGYFAVLSPRFRSAEPQAESLWSRARVRSLLGRPSATLETTVLWARQTNQSMIVVAKHKLMKEAWQGDTARDWIDIKKETWKREKSGRWQLARREEMPLRRTLHDMARRDETARWRWIEKQKKSPDSAATRAASKAVATIDDANLARMKRIVARYGFPGRSMVGDAGMQDAFTLIQHADAAPEFQRQCLVLMQAAAKNNEVDPSNVAYLTDRVRIRFGQKQLYGTQLDMRNPKDIRLMPIQDAQHVDTRRQQMGLPPVQEYLKLARELYGSSLQQSTRRIP